VTPEEFEEIVDRLLEVGVPPTAVGKAFDIDPFVVRERVNHLRVERYGSAELAEALGNFQWEMLEEAKRMVYEAPFGVRARFIISMVGKSMSLTARQSPETTGTMRKQLLDLMRQVDVGGDDALAGVDPEQFVAALGSDDDQDQGSDAPTAGSD
jgi:hypothetical protein